MAVKTKFSKEDFSEILSNYNLGEYKKFKAFKLGAVQTNLLLKTTKGKFVFRYYESRPEKYALCEMEILQFLAKHSYPCPAPIKNIRGKFLGKYRNKPFAFFEFMSGKNRKSADCRQIVKAMDKLHQITIGYMPKYREARDSYDPNLLEKCKIKCKEDQIKKIC